MAMDFDGPAAIVNDMYDRSVVLADATYQDMMGFIEALRGALNMVPPTIGFTFQGLPQPNIAAIPAQPTIGTIEFNMPAGKPGPMNLEMEDVPIDDFTVLPPTLQTRAAPDINLAPVPAISSPRDVAVPDAPGINLPNTPTMLAISTHTFGGLDLHEDMLDDLRDIPELSLLAPSKFSYTRGPMYASQVLDSLKAVINARLNGASGLDQGIELQIFQRGRDQQTKVALARQADVLRANEALGFPLPSGVLAGQLADSRREYFDQLATISRDITIRQAELAREDLQAGIATALQLESKLMDYAFQIEQLVFQSAKELADNEIAVHNAQIEAFKGLLAGYDSKARAYDTLIKAELSKVEVYKALIEAEKLKSDVNTALVQQYKAEIEGRLAVVEIFKAQVNAAQTLVELERTRLQTAGEQIRAIVAANNAEMSKVELFKAQISGDQLQLESYGRQVQAYSAKTQAQSEKARVAVAKFGAQVQAYSQQWDGWRALVAAESTRIEANAKQSGMKLDAYRVGVTASMGQAELYAKMWEGSFRQYEAAKTLSMQTAKINGDALMASRQATLEAAKVGAQVSSQAMASAFNAVNTSATISGSASLTQVINT